MINYKMKKLLVLVFLVLVSCTDKKVNQDNTRIALLKEEITAQKTENDSLAKKEQAIKNHIDSLENSSLDKAVVTSFLKPDKQFVINTDDNTLIKTAFDDIFDDSSCFWYSLQGSFLWHYRANDEVDVKDDISNINHLFYWHKRDEASIKTFFTKQKLELIYALFNNSNYYNETGLKNVIESLLLAYEEIGTNDKILEEIYKKSLDDEEVEIIKKIVSKKILALKANEDCDYNPFYNKAGGLNAFRAYKFWGRRYHENNREIVYQLLKDFYKNVHGNTPLLSKDDNDESEEFDEEIIEDEVEEIDQNLDDFALTNYKEPNQEAMDSIVKTQLTQTNDGSYDLEALKKIYKAHFPKVKAITLDNLLSEYNETYLNSGGWQNNTTSVVYTPKLKIYYIYVSNKNQMYHQFIFSEDKNEIIVENNPPLDDNDAVAKDGKWKIFCQCKEFDSADNLDSEMYIPIFHPDMVEGKYLYFVKAVTEKGNVFFSDIELLNYKKS